MLSLQSLDSYRYRDFSESDWDSELGNPYDIFDSFDDEDSDHDDDADHLDDMDHYDIFRSVYNGRSPQTRGGGREGENDRGEHPLNKYKRVRPEEREREEQEQNGGRRRSRKDRRKNRRKKGRGTEQNSGPGTLPPSPTDPVRYTVHMSVATV